MPHLIENLFQWLRTSEDHYLIRSCVFHYEFEFIHPFSDGNRRMRRLWQSLILGKLHKLFEHLPVENIVYANQQAYYDAINASTEAGDCGAFIDFMLQEISEALAKAAQKSGRDVGANVGVNEGKLLKILKSCGGAPAKNLAEGLGLSSRQVERLLKSLREKGFIRRVGSDKSGHWEVL